VSRTDDQRVLDILDAAEEIAGVVKDGRETWEQDRLRQLAVERLLEINDRTGSVEPRRFTGSVSPRFSSCAARPAHGRLLAMSIRC
jgi:hypothetical protein